MPQDQTQDAERLYDAVSKLVRAYQQRDRERICCHDISLNQWNALVFLVKEGSMRLNVLADHLALDKSTTSRVVDGMVRKGLIERVESEEDRRAVNLGVSPAGVALHAKVRAGLVAEEEGLMAGMPAETRQAAIGLLRRLADVANAEAGGGACAPSPAGGGCGPSTTGCGPKTGCGPAASGASKP